MAELETEFAERSVTSSFILEGGRTPTKLGTVGGGTPIPGCIPTPRAFAGALEVDATTGTPIAMDILSTNRFQF
jgi:hypothetical protein